MVEFHRFRDLRVAGGPVAVGDAVVAALVAARDHR